MVVRKFNFRSPSTGWTYDQLTCPLIGYTTSLEDRGGAVYTVAIMRLTSTTTKRLSIRTTPNEQLRVCQVKVLGMLDGIFVIRYVGLRTKPKLRRFATMRYTSLSGYRGENADGGGLDAEEFGMLRIFSSRYTILLLNNGVLHANTEIYTYRYTGNGSDCRTMNLEDTASVVTKYY